GTRRGYLVLATSLWGFLVIYSLFWTFGAPGTPPATGPQNLPGQELDAYEPVWRPFARDSNLANSPDYEVVKSFPEGFAKTPEAAGLAPNVDGVAGGDEVFNFFSGSPALQTPPVEPTWTVDPESVRYAEAANGRPVIGVTMRQTYQVGTPADNAPRDAKPPLTVGGAKAANDGGNVAPQGAQVGDIVPDGDSYTAFAFFDSGSPLFPSLVVFAIVLLLFVLHALLLARDERRERRELADERRDAEREREQVGAVAVGARGRQR
ncbi:MAG: hypothetical protein H0V19_02985, partial [Euzebyales bacterium]|nr:hypothetical protein [Euzebyales bacterium]